MKAFEIMCRDIDEANTIKAALDSLGVSAHRKDEGNTIVVSEAVNPDWRLDEQFWRIFKWVITEELCLRLFTPKIRVIEIS